MTGQLPMKFKLLLIIFLCSQAVLAEHEIPVIKATSKKVDIRDGNIFKKAYWNISPKLKPDVYETTSKNKKVTFYTDIDSISFVVKPDEKYNFIILLNNTDSALTQIVYKPTYLEILKNADQYNYDDHRFISKFTYTPIDDSVLIEIRKTFNLDSIIGTGNEISQIINLLHWVHNTYPHDGTKDVPQYKSMLELMIMRKNEHGTLDCGSLANVLNKCYLALGFKSRRVVCLPKDSTDFDCHSINMVYSETFNKWLWMDPTNDAYVMNENGELLSIAEVRERLINGLPLIINPDANWNHKMSVIKEEYLYNYMAKNLYAFQCFVTTGGDSKSNLLLPVEYKGIIPRTKINNPKCTNNPNDFWSKPE